MLVNVEIKNSPHDADFDPERPGRRGRGRAGPARGTSTTRCSSRRSTSRRSTGSTPSTREIPTGYLVVVDPLPLVALEIAHEHGHRALHPHLAALGEALRAGRRSRARPSSGSTLNVWTVNDPAEIVRLAEVGVDAIITDTPADREAGARTRVSARCG